MLFHFGRLICTSEIYPFLPRPSVDDNIVQNIIMQFSHEILRSPIYCAFSGLVIAIFRRAALHLWNRKKAQPTRWPMGRRYTDTDTDALRRATALLTNIDIMRVCLLQPSEVLFINSHMPVIDIRLNPELYLPLAIEPSQGAQRTLRQPKGQIWKEACVHVGVACTCVVENVARNLSIRESSSR